MSAVKSAEQGVGLGGYHQVVAGAPRLPQVNLLPPSVKERRQLQRLKSLLLAVLVAVVLLGAAAWFFTANMASNAQADLDAEQTRTSQLLAEQAKYSAVPTVKGQIEASEAARALATDPEIYWKALSDQIILGLPEGVRVGVIDVATTSPLAGTPAAPDAVTEQGVATVKVVVESPTVIETSAFLDVLEGIPGFMEATVTSETLGENEELQPMYEVQTSVQVDTTVYANRFKEAGEG